MKQRTITAVFFAAAMLGGIYGGKWTFFILISAICLGSAWEFLGMMLTPENDGVLGRKIFGTIIAYFPVLLFAMLGLLVNPIPPDHETIFTYADTFAIWALLPVYMLVELFQKSKSPFQHIGAVMTAVFYIGVPLAISINISTTGSDYHPNRIFGLLWLIWTNDTVAYLVGSRIGKTKLFERISPKKTWEGTLGGVVGTVLMAWGLAALFPTDFTVNQWLMLGAVVAVFGTLGDLVESMLKRSLGVKDSGTLLPGHGGLLDRFDSFLFVLPFVWLVLLLVR